MTKLKDSLPKKFETIAEAVAARRKLVRDLKVHHPAHPGLAAMRRCRKGSRCFLEACPRCRRVFRRHLVAEARRLGLDRQHWVRVSVIPKGWRVGGGELSSLDLSRLVANTTKALERYLPGVLIVGGIDISWNTWNNGDGHWQVHLYYLAAAPLSAELELAFRSALRTESATTFRSRPVTFRQVRDDGFFRCLTYSYKSVFWWKSYYTDKRLRRDGTPRRNSRDLPLPRQHQLELAMWFGDRRIGSRLILRGVRRTSRPGSRLRLSIGQAVR